jgi:hypothetical protein
MSALFCFEHELHELCEFMEVTREEMIELAKRETFHLDDRLVPFDRETLRAEAWLQGYEFAKRHERKLNEETAWGIYNFINEWKAGNHGEIPLSEALKADFDVRDYIVNAGESPAQ